MVNMGMEQPFELGESGSKSYLDHEAPTSISGGSSPKNLIYILIIMYRKEKKDDGY